MESTSSRPDRAKRARNFFLEHEDWKIASRYMKRVVTCSKEANCHKWFAAIEKGPNIQSDVDLYFDSNGGR